MTWQEKMIIGYARVSTDDQNINLQTDALKRAGCETILTDKGVSGTKRNRPGLEQVLSVLREGDTLIVWRLDRLGRSLAHLIDMVTGFQERGINFQSLHDGFDTSSSGGKLFFHILGALAEFERNLISERTIAGLQAAKARGRKGGRPPRMTPEQVAEARNLHANGNRLPDIAARYEVTIRTLTKWLVQ